MSSLPGSLRINYSSFSTFYIELKPLGSGAPVTPKIDPGKVAIITSKISSAPPSIPSSPGQSDKLGKFVRETPALTLADSQLVPRLANIGYDEEIAHLRQENSNVWWRNAQLEKLLAESRAEYTSMVSILVGPTGLAAESMATLAAVKRKSLLIL